MAYAGLNSLAQTIERILNNHDQYYTCFPKKQEVISIHEYVIFLQSFLEEFPEKANHLEEQIRDAANEAEDNIEYLMLERIHSPNRSTKPSVAPSKFKFKFKLHRSPGKRYEAQLKKASEKIESIAWEVMKIKKSFGIKEEEHSDFSDATSSSSRLAPTTKNDMVGFDDNLLAIKARLCGQSSQLQVIPIHSMGGIGKTTLARTAYGDPLTMQHFDIRAWVTVSQDYSDEKVVSDLIVSMKISVSSNDSKAEKVYKTLKGRRYLVVMDDMWSTKAWDDVKMMFPDDDNGSRIILTTRLLDVASYAHSCTAPYLIPFMDEKQSWNLIQHKVFTTHQNCPPELEEIGKEIARNCKGLPLAIVVVAGLLSTSLSRSSWEKIAKNVNSAARYTEDGQIALEILSLSYTNLPQHLRQCLLYIGSFPEDYEMRVSRLIKLWVAEGFIRANECKSLEAGAQEYLVQLVKRSLVLVNTRNSNDEIQTFMIHDLVRDLCRRKAEEEKFQRRIAIGYYNPYRLANYFSTTTRTIICVWAGDQGSQGSLEKFRLLSVLDVIDAHLSKFNTLPTQLFELVHLRYLALRYPIIIPAAISNLRNLQTLIVYPILQNCYPSCAVRLPLEIWTLPQLRHLVSCFFGQLPDPKRSNFFPLENLQTLSQVSNFICNQRILKMIPNLKYLGIAYEGDEYDEDYHLDNLQHLRQLEKLKIEVPFDVPFGQNLNPTFPRTLKKLTLRGWRLPWKDMTIVGSLPNLEVLKLKQFACEGNTWETTEGEFPRLKFLLISRSRLKHWITESSHFPMLKRLALYRCGNLSEIPDGIGEILTLEIIEIKNARKSLQRSAKRIQEEQQGIGNDAFQVRCVHE